MCAMRHQKGRVFSFLSWASGPRRLFWPKQVTQLNLCGSVTMPGRRLLNSLRCRGLPRALPVRSSSQVMPMGPSSGWPCVVTASRYGGSGSGAAVPGWNPGQAAEESCGPTTIADEQETRCGASWVPWRLRWKCRLCWIPTFTSCPTCGGAVCEECRRGGDFCPFCGSSDDEQ